MTINAISAWIIPLKGHAYDLEDLPIYLSGSPVTVIKRETGFFMQISTSVIGDDSERIADVASEYLSLINGAATLLLNNFHPLELGDGFFGIDENGDIAHTVIQLRSVMMRVKAGHGVIVVNGVTLPDERAGAMSDILRCAIEDRGKADALALIGRPSPTWSELYLVFELVEANTQGRMHSECWISKADKIRFQRTANSYTALGKAARHGKDTAQPPSTPLTHCAATNLMRNLVARWFKHGTLG